MKIKKEDLGFLEVFSMLADKSPLGDKLQITVDGGKAIFCLFGTTATAVKELTITDQNEKFDLAFPVVEFESLINHYPENALIEFTQDRKISHAKGASYSFENIDVIFPPIGNMFSKIQNRESEAEFFITLNDMEKLKKVIPFIGIDFLEFVTLNQGHFVALDNVVVGFSNSKNQAKEMLYFPKTICDVWIKYFSGDDNDQQLKVYYFINDNTYWWLFEIKGVFVGVADPTKKAFPDVFKDRFKQEYDHQQMVSVDSNDLSSVLNRMQVVAQHNENNRLFFTVVDGALKIESKDFNKSSEFVKIIDDNANLKNEEFSLGCTNLMNIIDQLDSEKILFYIKPQSEGKAKAVKISNSDNSIYFAHQLRHVR